MDKDNLEEGEVQGVKISYPPSESSIPGKKKDLMLKVLSLIVIQTHTVTVV